MSEDNQETIFDEDGNEDAEEAPENGNKSEKTQEKDQSAEEPTESETQEETSEEQEEETQEGEGFDWGEEEENVGGKIWFDPEPGTFELKFLDEGTPDTREYEGEERDIGVFQVEILDAPESSEYEEGMELKWSVSKGTTETSLWGQIVKIANHEKGLTGEEVTFTRQGQGTDTNYTIQEAAAL